ncbi:MAG: hypothetical protein M1819_005277 [Sarea resinae]|nr:MAG: hypothetical protein M1819_005277 [Sarea resinae]
MASSVIAVQMPGASTTTTAAPSSTTIADIEFTHGLAGVHQTQNKLFTNLLWISLGAICVFVLLVRFAQMFNAHLRHLFTLTADEDRQAYWATDRTRFWPNLKKHLLYAPLWKNRHNAEWHLSSVINMGTLPSRFHALLLGLYLASNVIYCALLDYGSKNQQALLADLRGRSGVLSVVNMIPLIILTTRNNPLIGMLKVSFDTYNLIHRWMGRIVALEAIVHTAAWAANTVEAMGGDGIGKSLSHGADSLFFRWGMVGTAGMAFLLLHSPSPIRHAFYETFLHLHQVGAFVAILGTYLHLEVAGLPQLPYIRAVVGLWACHRLSRWCNIAYNNMSLRKGRMTHAAVEALPGETCRVTFELQRLRTIKPGSHVYVYFPTLSYWMSHPFSVAWTEDQPTTLLDSEKPAPASSPSPQQTALDAVTNAQSTRTTLTLVISARTGMTSRLHARALANRHSPGHVQLPALIEGPYGGLESLHSYGTVLLFAGGIGITHQVPHIRDLLIGRAAGTSATRRITLVWSVRSAEHLEWVRPFMDEILSMPLRRETLKILLFVTKPRSPREVVSPSRSVQMYPGRANPGVIVDKEILDRVGAMAVTVCGPGGFADSVRGAVRRRVGVGSIDFLEEAFSW